MTKLLRKENTSLQRQNGATMIEIMISILIFSVGLLGIASTQTLGLTNTQSALNRSYAAQLSYEIIDIMRSNRVETGTVGGIFDALNTTTSPSPYTETAGCDLAGTSCSANELANHQVALWAERVATLLPDGQASITVNGNAYDMEITWVDFKNSDETLARVQNQNVANDPADSTVYLFTMSFQL